MTNKDFAGIGDKCGHCGRGGLPVDNPWIAIDLDKTIIKSAPWPNMGEPYPGAVEALNMFKDMGFKIMIWTARMTMTDPEGGHQNVNKIQKEIEDHLRSHCVPFDFVMPYKKPAFVFRFIDDRAIKFKGDWDEVVAEVVSDMEELGVPMMADKRDFVKELCL